MPKDNSSSSFATGTVVTVAALGLGALAGYLLASGNTDNAHEHSYERGDWSLPALTAPNPTNIGDDERKKKQKNRNKECAVCLTDISRYPSRIMACRHPVHEQCWKRMQESDMTCPTCSETAFNF